MSLTIIKQFEARGRKLYRNEAWHDVSMAAFVGVMGAFRPNCRAQFGIGLIWQKEDGSGNGDEYLFWGTVSAHCLITAWRAAQLVNMVTMVRENVLYSAYAMSIRTEEGRMEGFRRILEEALPTTYLPGLRTDMLEAWQVPDQELEEMLAICTAPDSNIRVSVDELEEELVAGIIHCTPRVRAVFDQAELEGWKPLRIEEASKKLLTPRQSFGEFCWQAKMKNLCVRLDDGNIGQLRPTEIDAHIMYMGYRYGKSRQILCRVRRNGRMMHAGSPVLSLTDGEKWVLYEMLYRDGQMLAKVRVLSGRNEGDALTIPLTELADRSPQMVGVTFSREDGASVQERRRGYIAVESFGQRLLRRFGLKRADCD